MILDSFFFIFVVLALLMYSEGAASSITSVVLTHGSVCSDCSPLLLRRRQLGEIRLLPVAGLPRHNVGLPGLRLRPRCREGRLRRQVSQPAEIQKARQARCAVRPGSSDAAPNVLSFAGSSL